MTKQQVKAVTQVVIEVEHTIENERSLTGAEMAELVRWCLASAGVGDATEAEVLGLVSEAARVLRWRGAEYANRAELLGRVPASGPN